MRIGRLIDGRYVVVADGNAYDVTPLVRNALKRVGEGTGDSLVRVLDMVRAELGPASFATAIGDVDTCSFAAPVAHPTKIIGAPVNYSTHVAEAEADPEINAGARLQRIESAGLFLKATSALVGPAEGITLRFPDRRTDHEVEVCAVIGRTTSNVDTDVALEHVAGYAIGIDATLRGPEDRSFRKSIDTYALIGPYLLTADEAGDPRGIPFSIEVNGERRQAATTGSMIKNIAELVSWASHWYTLHPGDVIMTGTPDGVGPIRPGDVLHCQMLDVEMDVAVRAGYG